MRKAALSKEVWDMTDEKAPSTSSVAASALSSPSLSSSNSSPTQAESLSSSLSSSATPAYFGLVPVSPILSSRDTELASPAVSPSSTSSPRARASSTLISVPGDGWGEGGGNEESQFDVSSLPLEENGESNQTVVATGTPWVRRPGLSQEFLDTLGETINPPPLLPLEQVAHPPSPGQPLLNLELLLDDGEPRGVVDAGDDADGVLHNLHLQP